MPGDKYLFIDLDNTLYPYRSCHEPAQFALERYIAEELEVSQREITIKLMAARDRVKLRLGKTASSHSRLLYLSDFAHNSSKPIKPSFILSAEQTYWRTYLQYLKLFDGAENFLRFFRQEGYKLVLVTDLTNAVQYRKIAWLKLDAILDLVITSEDSGGDKISGFPEKLLLERLGEIHPQSISLGDELTDHLFPANTRFFRKLENGKTSFARDGSCHFSDYTHLIKYISQ